MAKKYCLVKMIYNLTMDFPSDEKFGLVLQMRRAVVSIPSNLAEGQARRTTKDYIRFVSNSEGSLAELETQLIIAIELDFCKESETKDCFNLMLEIQKMLNALRISLTQKLK